MFSTRKLNIISKKYIFRNFEPNLKKKIFIFVYSSFVIDGKMIVDILDKIDEHSLHNNIATFENYTEQY